MSQRQLAIGLVVVAVALVAYGALSFGFDAGNKKALLAVVLAGSCTTVAAYIWGRLPART